MVWRQGSGWGDDRYEEDGVIIPICEKGVGCMIR